MEECFRWLVTDLQSGEVEKSLIFFKEYVSESVINYRLRIVSPAN